MAKKNKTVKNWGCHYKWLESQCCALGKARRCAIKTIDKDVDPVNLSASAVINQEFSFCYGNKSNVQCKEITPDLIISIEQQTISPSPRALQQVHL